MSQFITLLILTLFCLDLIWWWHARRQFPLTLHRHRHRRQIIAFIAILAIFSLASILISRLMGRGFEAFFPRLLIVFSLIWHLLVLPLVLTLNLTLGTTRQAVKLFSRSQRKSTQPTDDASASTMNRRDFLAHASAFAPAFLSGTGTIYANGKLDALRVRHFDLPIPNLPSALDGLCIAHVSDTHLGRFTDAATFRNVVASLNDLDADLVVHTGDIINDRQSDLPMASQLLREIRSRHGLFICEGNHDLIEGRASFETFMRRERQPILIDEIAQVAINGQTIELLGLPWYSGGRTSGADGKIFEGVTRLANRRSSSALSILLAHHPHAFDAAVVNGIPLTFGGHTHGGQLNLTSNFGMGSAMYRYWSGVYSRDGCHTVISNGAGNWFPLRINAPAEVARIVLKRA